MPAIIHFFTRGYTCRHGYIDTHVTTNLHSIRSSFVGAGQLAVLMDLQHVLQKNAADTHTHMLRTTGFWGSLISAFLPQTSLRWQKEGSDPPDSLMHPLSAVPVHASGIVLQLVSRAASRTCKVSYLQSTNTSTHPNQLYPFQPSKCPFPVITDQMMHLEWSWGLRCTKKNLPGL